MSDAADLSLAFVDALAVAVPAGERYDDALGALLERGRSGWPALAIDGDAFVRHIALSWTDGIPTPAALALVHAPDLYLACACTRGDVAAATAFAATYRATIRSAVQRVIPSSDRADDAVQMTLERLLLGNGESCALARYSGRAALDAFVKVVALRVALSMLRSEPRGHVGDAALAALDDGDDDPELRYLKALYKEEFRSAFAAALASLSVHDRSLLRYQIVDQLSIDQVAAIYGRPRSTMGRHLLEARSRLIEQTRAQLRSSLQITASELESVLRLVQSSVEISVRRLLGDPTGEGAP